MSGATIPPSPQQWSVWASDAIWQGPAEHLDGMLSEEQRVDDAVQTGAGRNRRRFGLWGYMSRFRAGQMVLALQIIRRDVDIPHRHLWIGMTE
jgi:hypothetical protein